MLGISWPHLKGVQIPMPEFEEQEKIVRFLTAIDHQLNSLEKQIDPISISQRGQVQQMTA